MNKRKLLSLFFAALLLLSGCDTNTNASVDTLDTGLSDSADSTNLNVHTDYTDSDFSDAIQLTFNGDSLTQNGSAELSNGLSFSNNTLTITKAGDYMLSGTLHGQVVVDASSNDSVHLYLNGVSISSDSSSAIYGSQSEEIIITLVENTTNILSDGQSYVYDSADETEPNAALFSKDDLILAGEGTLLVNGNYADGIRSKDDLVFQSGSYEVTAVSDAIQGKDSVEIYGGSYTLNAGNDAVKSSNDTDTDKGYVTIYGGNFYVEAGDDAFHAETNLLIEDGNIEIASCFEGLEGLTVTINSGDIRLTATDDGINAAGGSDSGESFFGGGKMGGNSSASITINGGTVYVNAEGDGIDSNGTFTVNGGEVYVDGPSNAANGALDYELEASVNGGIVVAVGASGMALNLGNGSSQASLLYQLEQWAEAGSAVTLTDSSGQELLSYTPSKSYNSVVLSCAGLTTGENYTLTCGSQTYTFQLTDSIYSNGQSGMGSGFGGRGEMGEAPDGTSGGFGGRGKMGKAPDGATAPEGAMEPPEAR